MNAITTFTGGVLPWRDRRSPAKKQEDALLEAFRRLVPRERMKLVRFARLRQSTRIK